MVDGTGSTVHEMAEEHDYFMRKAEEKEKENCAGKPR
jgi:hypothetical protein